MIYRIGYLPKKGVSFELIEFQSGGRTVQGGVFGPDSKLFQDPGTAAVLVHAVEADRYSGPTMFLGYYLAESGCAALAYNGVHSGESFRTSKFEVAVDEVDAAITFALARGFKNISRRT